MPSCKIGGTEMKSITVKITARYEGWEDISDEIMFSDIVQSIAFRNDFDFELVEEDENPFDMSNPIYEAGYNQGHFDAKYNDEIAREMDEQKDV